MAATDKSNSSDVVRVPKLVGKYKEVRVTFVGVPVLRPTGAAQARYADDGFATHIIDEVFSRQSILTRLRGVVTKSHHCRKCDANLMGLKAHRRRFAIDISYKQLPPFRLEIEMPAIPCRQCGTSNAINEKNTEYVICGAIAEAFKSLKKHV